MRRGISHAPGAEETDARLPLTDGAAMLRYTARNGTTFQFDPTERECVRVIHADDPGESVDLDVEDLREFLQHLEDQLDQLHDLPSDADCSSVAAD